jgi:formylmethanofuran dehydrogenase subunit A
MDRGFRNEKLAQVHPEAAVHSQLEALEREYSLYEIAIMTRAGPARSVGLSDRGHLGVGAAADVTVYRDLADREKMFSAPEYVFKDGEVVARDGRIVKVTRGATHVVQPDFDRGIEKRLRDYFERYHTIRFDNFAVSADELDQFGSRATLVHPCARAQS